MYEVMNRVLRLSQVDMSVQGSLVVGDFGVELEAGGVIHVLGPRVGLRITSTSTTVMKIKK